MDDSCGHAGRGSIHGVIVQTGGRVYGDTQLARRRQAIVSGFCWRAVRNMRISKSYVCGRGAEGQLKLRDETGGVGIRYSHGQR